MRRDATDPETWGIPDSHDESDRGEVLLETDGLEKYYEQSQPLLEKLRGNDPNYVRASTASPCASGGQKSSVSPASPAVGSRRSARPSRS
nr:hypothetical protein [Haloferax sp. BAB-2207]